jgi:hypothetical protein
MRHNYHYLWQKSLFMAMAFFLDKVRKELNKGKLILGTFKNHMRFKVNGVSTKKYISTLESYDRILILKRILLQRNMYINEYDNFYFMI